LSPRITRRGLLLIALGALLLSAGVAGLPSCNLPDESAQGGGKRPKVVQPASTPPTAAGRRKIEMPPPLPPQPKPDGQPQRPEDMKKLAAAAAAGKPDKRPGAFPIVVLDENRRKIGETLVDLKARRIEVPARVNMVQGILEYVSCASTGKLHEAVLEQLDRPSHLHLALLLLNLEPTETAPDEKLGSRVVRLGNKVRVSVEVTDPKTGVAKRLPAEAWLYSRKRKGSPKAIEWVFQGSQFWNGDYSADQSKSVIGLVPDPTTVVGAVGNEGNPYQGMEGFEVFTKVIPPKGTPVTLIIEPVDPAKP
jgi:hypothetical protein